MDMDSASSVVLQALTQATSQDTAVLKPAEEQLRQWETQPGFYSVLLVRYDVDQRANTEPCFFVQGELVKMAGCRCSGLGCVQLCVCLIR
uniref:Importin N-terminal domain-containing protein n=1 Tax=Periophthalmus magnuspinnatus TaxID=409849 RepID=A0A3B3ZPJ2_9GOBI